MKPKIILEEEAAEKHIHCFTLLQERQTIRCIKKANWGKMESVTVAVIKDGLTPISVMISRTPEAWHKNHYLLSTIKHIFALLAGDKNFLKLYPI